MKKYLIALTVIAAGLLAFSLPAELPIGSAMPKGDVKMRDVSGKEISLKDAQMKNGLLVMFSCNTCPYVLKNQSRTNEISRFALINNIGVVLVNSNEAQRDDDDSYEAMQKYAKDQGYEWYYVVDEKSEIADAFGATRTPENFLFNKDGKLVYHGAIDDSPTEAEVNRKHLREAMNEMLEGKAISTTVTRSVGCTIKRLK